MTVENLSLPDATALLLFRQSFPKAPLKIFVSHATNKWSDSWKRYLEFLDIERCEKQSLAFAIKTIVEILPQDLDLLVKELNATSGILDVILKNK